MPGTLTLIKGNLWSTTAELVVHGVNCRGKFASGFAGDVAKRYPDVKRRYVAKHEKDGWGLGEVQFVMTGDHNRFVANMATQEAFGHDGRQYVDYDAVRAAVREVLRVAEGNGWSVAMPMVGCGLGGGEWPVVEGIVREELAGRDVDVEVYSL